MNSSRRVAVLGGIRIPFAHAIMEAGVTGNIVRVCGQSLIGA